MSGFKGIVQAIAKDLENRLPKQRATQRRKLSELYYLQKIADIIC